MMFKVSLQAKYGKDAEITAVCFYAICSQLQISVQPQQYPHNLQELDTINTNASQHSICLLYQTSIGISSLETLNGEVPTAVSSKF